MSKLFTELSQKQEVTVSGGRISFSFGSDGDRGSDFGDFRDIRSGDILARGRGSASGTTGEVNVGNID